jgi:hypothetical protein
MNRVPRNRDEFVEIFLSPGGRRGDHVMWFLFAAIAWSQWLTRNERVFQYKVLFNPVHPLYRAISLMLQWRPLVKAKRRDGTGVVIARLDAGL